jgi:hypothetical protein
VLKGVNGMNSVSVHVTSSTLKYKYLDSEAIKQHNIPPYVVKNVI